MALPTPRYLPTVVRPDDARPVAPALPEAPSEVGRPDASGTLRRPGARRRGARAAGAPRVPRLPWTVMLVPPPRVARPVRAFRLRRRLLLAPALGIALLLVVVSLGGARVGERVEAERTRPQLGDLRVRLREATLHADALADSIARLRAELAAVAEERARRTAAAAAASPLAGRRAPDVVLPVQGRITSRFARSRLHPILRIPRPHRGLDIAAPSGTTITVPAAGRVVKVAREMGYGLVVHVDHGNGVTTRYAHCRSVLVSPGDAVAAGTAIATVGRTGLASAPHVHYEVRVRGEAVDPLRVAVVGTR